MKKFNFILAALIAVMFIGCAQPTDDTTPIIPTSEPEAQPTDIYEAALYGENSDGSICLYSKFIFQNDQYELQLSGETSSDDSLYNAEISDDKLSIKPVSNVTGSGNLRLFNSSVIIYSTLAQNWHLIVDECYKKL